MTEAHLIVLGFYCTEEYSHDQFHTKRYTKGVLYVEFTYEGEKLLDTELSIEEVIGKPVTLKDMQALTPILGNWGD